MERLYEIENNRDLHTVFVDFFDTIVHRTAHPNQALRLWAKVIIRELGLTLKVDELYFLRQDASKYLALKYDIKHFEVNYNELITEVFNRLVSTSKLKHISFEDFKAYFELAEIRAEINVQYLNESTIKVLKALKNKKYKIYCVSDFYTSAEVIRQILIFHKIGDLFDEIFVSSEYNKSKFSGNFYSLLLDKLSLQAKNVVMVGDSYSSDVANAKAEGLTAIYIPNKKESKTKHKYLLGSDRSDYRKILKKLYTNCNSNKAPANTDYVLFYAVYVERLYYHLKKGSVRNILFLSREGLFLKKMFDYYQQHFALRKEDAIKTHYFKSSRQASMLVSLKDIEEENFTFLRRKYPDLSLYNFLQNFTFSNALIESIIEELNFQENKDEVIVDFLDSTVFEKLKKNATFINAYNNTKHTQKKAFDNYLDSFRINFQTEGMHLADIGWGGSMQECLYAYFNGKVKVYGHYLGLTEIYTIQKETNRWGLNFSVFPYATYYDNILRGNTELNEQLLSAGHGSTLSYNESDAFTNEFHHDVEKKAFDEHIFEIQEYMFKTFKELLKELDSVCYDNTIVQKEMVDYALKVGLFASKRKVASAMKISKGFYTNVGNFSNGLKMSPEKYTRNKFKLLKEFILSPDTLFAAVLRIKPYLYAKNKYFIAYLIPTWLIYYYIKINQWVKRTVFQKISRFKYAYLK